MRSIWGCRSCALRRAPACSLAASYSEPVHPGRPVRMQAAGATDTALVNLAKASIMNGAGRGHAIFRNLGERRKRHHDGELTSPPTTLGSGREGGIAATESIIASESNVAATFSDTTEPGPAPAPDLVPGDERGADPEGTDVGTEGTDTGGGTDPGTLVDPGPPRTAATAATTPTTSTTRSSAPSPPPRRSQTRPWNTRSRSRTTCWRSAATAAPGGTRTRSSQGWAKPCSPRRPNRSRCQGPRSAAGRPSRNRFSTRRAASAVAAATTRPPAWALLRCCARRSSRCRSCPRPRLASGRRLRRSHRVPARAWHAVRASNPDLPTRVPVLRPRRDRRRRARSRRCPARLRGRDTRTFCAGRVCRSWRAPRCRGSRASC